MKKDYGLVNREEGPLFGAPVLPRRDDRKGPKRLVAIGSSVLLLAAGAVLGYAALPSRSVPVTSVSNLEVNAPAGAQMSIAVDPTMEMAPPTGGNLLGMTSIDVPPEAVAPISHAYMPPVSEFDLNMDGFVSVEEYLHRSIRRHDGTLKRVEASLMSDVAKDFITDRLRRSYAREAWCVAQIAAKDIAAGGMAMSDFKLFYSMIQTTCDIYDPEIPREFQPGDKPLPTEAPIEPTTPTPTPMIKEPIRKFYPTEIPEGHAIKCEWDDVEVYRYTNTMRRLYPNPVIAASWDPFWGFALVADCSMLPRGDDMELNGSATPAPRKKMSPQDLQDGQAMKCEWDEPEVYRFSASFRRWYPNPEIASSWDPYWDTAVVVECADLPRGEDMEMFGHPLSPPTPPYRMKTPPALLFEGQPIKCDFSEPEVYRFENSVRRWYPNPEIAASWDPTWFTFVEANCSMLPRGDDMQLKTVPSPWTPPVKLTPGELKEGQAIKCEWDEPEVFRFTESVRRWYPNPEIAASYDPFWSAAVAADCTLILRGDDMPERTTPRPPVPPSFLTEGQSIKCDPNPDFVYRWTNGVYRFYPSGAMAASYDPMWWMAPIIDCSNLVRGEDMDWNPDRTPPPVSPRSWLQEGQAIKCDPNPDFVYRWTNGVYRFYPSGDLAASWDPYWYAAVAIDCSTLVRGEDMPYNGVPPTPPPPVKVPSVMLYEGQAIKCDESDEVFRFTGGLRRYYPSREIADSWDPYWTAAVLAECSDLTRGKDMRMRAPTMYNGQAVRCDGDDSSSVFRYWDGSIFEYPDLDVATSWDATWSWTVLVVDCTSLPKGPSMQKKLPPPLNLPEGHTIKCGAMEEGFFRYTSGMRRLYPTMAIAMSWDPNWDVVALEVDCSSLPRGDDMDFYQPPLVEGLAVSCGDSTAVFRYTNGTIRLYPTQRIADSWDPMWYFAVRVNCARLTQGPDMQMKPYPLMYLREGQSVRCAQDDLALYRFASGEVRRYSNLDIALSWDPNSNWTEAVLIDCTQLRFGPDMEYKQPPLFDGQTVKCSLVNQESFRYWNGTIRPYPEFRIAQSWGQDAGSDEALWLNATLVYCPGFARGPEMRFNLGKLVEGQPIICDHQAIEIYRYTSGQRRLYPTTVIAAMWDPMWHQFVLVDCSRVPRGDDMKPILPIVPEGRSVKCLDMQEFYYFTNGTLRLYPSNDVASTWDPEWMDPIYIECAGFPQGPPMKRKLPSPFGLPEGQAIKCGDDEAEVYRYTSGLRRLYPNEAVALSWDLFWESYKVVDCTMLPRGTNMQSRWPLKEGETVHCGTGTALFRYTNGTIRLYPSNTIALSWDPNALTVTTSIDCRRYPQGPNMAIRSPIWIPEGQAIKCSTNDTETYRYACGDRRLYPSAEVAESWDPRWKNPMIVDCRWISSSYPMQKYAPPVPAMLVEEQTVTCPGDSNYYRFCSGELRLYWNDKVGRSWDRNYVSNSMAVADCTSLRKGNMLTNQKPNIPEGQAVTCDTTGTVYRYENLVLRRYATHEVAAYWDANWMNAVALECEFFLILEDMPWPLPRYNLTEGQSTKCDANKPEFYRYASGVLRWYPSVAVASSWDPHWSSNFTVVNCSTYSRGPDMELKQPPLTEGQPVKCDDGYGIYRYTNNTVRLYPTPEIAASWDPMYTTATRINCSTIFTGADMKLKLPPPTGLPEGQAIKCSATESAVYRMISGQRRWYPSPYIATSWDANWGKFVVVDCTYVPEGPPMRFNQPYIYQYQAIKCDDASPVYRYNNGTIRWYPSPEIAWSWDPNWPSAIKVDCSNFTRGLDHDFKLRSPVGLPEGQAIRCGQTRTEIYRLTGGQMRWYPSPEIATSWDPNWGQSLVVECSDLPVGNPMPYNYPVLTEGQALKCDTGSAVYRYSDGVIRWYPSPEIAWSWDANWKSAIMVDCKYLQKGPSLDFKLRSPFGLPEGQAIKCKLSATEIFRLSSGQMRWYPSPAIATSWDPYWGTAVAVDCSYLTRGDDMKFKQPPIVEGQPVKCDDSSMIFRYVNGSIRWYPSPEVAWSWDHKYMYPTFVDCSVLPRGPALKLRVVDNWKQLDGNMVQLSFDGTQLCGVNRGGDAWCANENIRGEGVTTWRRLPGTFSQVVVYGDVLYAVDSSNKLYVGSAITSDPAWTPLSGSFKHISTDNKQLCGVTPANTVECADSDIRTAPNWRKLAGGFSQVELVNGRLFGVRDDMGLFAGRAYGDPQWFYLRSPMQQVSFDGVRVCGTSNGQVKCASNGLSAGPQWSASLGSMYSVIVNAGDMYGVSSSGEVFYRAVE